MFDIFWQLVSFSSGQGFTTLVAELEVQHPRQWQLRVVLALSLLQLVGPVRFEVRAGFTEFCSPGANSIKLVPL